jgi:hypothetical protein
MIKIIKEFKGNAVAIEIYDAFAEEDAKVAERLFEEKLAYKELSDKDGNFKKRELNPELAWDVTFELPDYVPKKLSDIKLKPGEHEKVEIHPVKIV